MMSDLRGWLRRLRALVQRRRMEAEMDAEMRSHIQMEVEHLLQDGTLTPEEARRRALVAFGGVERTKERARDVRSVRWLGDWAQDSRLGARALRRAPGFTVVAVLTLTLGIGATTAMFSVVRGVLLDPLPYPDSERLVAVWSRFLPESGFDFPQFPLSPPEYFDYRAAADAVPELAAYRGYRATLAAGDGRPLSVRGAASTANLFAILRARPLLGRTFAPHEDVPDGASVVLLGHGLWHRAFGGDPAVLGRTIRVNGRAVEVIGIMPADFAFPSPETELWTPAGLDPVNSSRGAHVLSAVGRLRDGVDLQEARAELDHLMTRWAQEYPDVHRGHFLFLTPLLDDVVGNTRPALLVLLGAVAFVLLIVCANVANLLLTRGEARARELAVRSALGAGRGRLARQFLAEAAVLSAAGAVGGVLLARVLVDATLALGADSIPRAGNVAVDGRLLLFVAGIAVFSTIVFALAPLTRLDMAAPRRALGAGTRSTPAQGRLRHALVTAQVALSVVVTIGAGLMLRSFRELTTVDPGFTVDNALIADISLPAGDYDTPEKVVALYQELLARLQQTPGARAASASSSRPLGDGAPNHDFVIEGTTPPAPGEPAQSGDFIIVDPGYAGTFGIDIVQGRFFAGTDRAGSLPVVVVNRTLAEMFWPGENPVGRRLRDAGGQGPWLEVIGVVEDVQYRSPDQDMRPAWYVPLAQMSLSVPSGARSFSVTVRGEGDPTLLAQPMRDVLRALDAGLPIIRMQPLVRVRADAVARPRFVMVVLTLFAALALALGAIGIYGVLSGTVAGRTHEFGVRIALGAGARELTGLVLRSGLRIVLAGLLLGVAGALVATQLVRGMLFRVSATDPVTFTAVGATICLVAIAASLIPLRRALRSDPARALRAD
jgi:putative ABC transport system permease protein